MNKAYTYEGRGKFHDNWGKLHGYSTSNLKCFYAIRLGIMYKIVGFDKVILKMENIGENNYAFTNYSHVDECDENESNENLLVGTLSKSSNDAWYLEFGCSNQMWRLGFVWCTQEFICSIGFTSDMSKKLKDVWYVPRVTKTLMFIGQ